MRARVQHENARWLKMSQVNHSDGVLHPTPLGLRDRKIFEMLPGPSLIFDPAIVSRGQTWVSANARHPRERGSLT